jgi:hypothetical protein
MELDDPPFEAIPEAPKRFWRTMGRVLIGLFVLWGGCHLFLNSPFSPWAGFLSNGCFHWDPQKTETLGRYKFPPSLRNLETDCRGLQGWYSTAKFEMAPGDMNGFIATTMIKSPLSSTVAPSDFSTFLRDLMGERKPATYLYRKADNRRDFSQEILIVTHNPTKYIVYVVVLGGD